MADDQDIRSLARSLKAFQDVVQRAGPAATASYTLTGSILFLGGIGYGIDRWRGSFPVWSVVGLVLGIVFGMYQLAMSVWRK
jgi:F0F1-type ATP synthase assembly protein I